MPPEPDRKPPRDASGRARPTEEGLLRAARARAGSCSDRDLARILTRVAARRAARRGRRAPGAAGTLPRGAPTPPPPAPEVGSAPGGTLLRIHDVGPTVRRFVVARPSGFAFTAGQHTKLGAPGAGQARSYSIASAPHDPHLEFCIELVPGGRLTPGLFALRPGQRLELGRAAKGRFGLDPSARVHLMVATVTGIAPLRSMLRHALREGAAGRSFIVLHGASYLDELAYREELEATAGVRYAPTVSRLEEPRNRGWTGATGRVEELARSVAADLSPAETRVYACGHPGMLANVRRDLAPLGFAVSTESFG